LSDPAGILRFEGKNFQQEFLPMQKTIAVLLLLIIALLGAMGFQNFRTGIGPEFSTPYQAVVLNNNQVYFGKLENAGSQYPILRDVFYIVGQVNPEANQVANVLVRRGKELHGPEYMVLNRQSIMLIEPVKDDSQVAKLIAEQKKHGG
jgi:hypothetical protein